jgi:hypothetical protein
VRINQGHELREQQLSDVHQIALALEHVRKSRQIGLEPVLLRVPVGRQAQVPDHRVDVVLELRTSPRAST